MNASKKGDQAQLPAPAVSHSSTPSRTILKTVLLSAALLVAAGIQFSGVVPRSSLKQQWNLSNQATKEHSPQCPVQPDPIVPATPFAIPESFRLEAAERLAQAVRIPTVSYDDNGPIGEDSRWDVFYDFHKWLFSAYPSVFEHDAVNVTIVNRLAILTTVKGSDPSLKPLMLMSHFDVVPAPKETYSRWTYPPFSGAIDKEGKYVHGRGAGDCKNLMTAQYEALSLLLQSGFQPRRTIILAHGNDEETTGRNGARKLSPYIERIYGHDSILMIVDEGVENLKMFGQAWALPGTAEKGYLDVEVTVAVKGGHSSVPPQHTGIGIAADIVKAIEAHSQDQDFAPSFGKEDPILQFHVCAAENARGYPKAWSKLVNKRNWNALAKKFAEYEPEAKALISTTSSVNVIKGGAKINALPEVVTFLINHRLAFSSSSLAVQRHLERIIKPVAKKYKLGLHAFQPPSNDTSFTGNGYIELSTFGDALEPAPHTPTSGPVWDLFAGTVRHAMNDAESNHEPYLVSPFASTGNTDTASYWNLTRNIFRYDGSPVEEYETNMHTVDEKVSISGHLKVVEWIHTLVQNADAFEG